MLESESTVYPKTLQHQHFPFKLFRKARHKTRNIFLETSCNQGFEREGGTSARDFVLTSCLGWSNQLVFLADP